MSELFNNINKIITVEENGLIRVSYGGKVFILFLSGVLSLWVLMLVLINYNVFLNSGKSGKAVFYMAGISMSLLVLTIYEKFFIGKFYINTSRQFSVLLFFITVFVLIFCFTPDDFPNTKNYANPLIITYIYILFYMIGFYILHNLSNN